MDFSELTLGEKLVAIGGIVLFIAVLLPWYKITNNTGFGAGSESFSLWTGSQGIAILVMLGCIVAVGVMALRFFDVFDISDQGVPESLVVLVASGLATLLVVYRVISVPTGGLGGSFFGVATGIDFGRSILIIIPIAAAAALMAGAFMKFQEER